MALICDSQHFGGVFRRLLDAGGELWWDKDLSRGRIESGYPLWGVDFDAANLPQEIGRDREAICFTKGCYLGQETVARLDALGHVNRKLGGVVFDRGELVPVHTPLRDPDTSRVVGETRSCAWSVRCNKPLALAMLRVGHDAKSTQLESDWGPAEVMVLPLPASAD